MFNDNKVIILTAEINNLNIFLRIWS